MDFFRGFVIIEQRKQMKVIVMIYRLATAESETEIRTVRIYSSPMFF
jgi:hypothetical protein